MNRKAKSSYLDAEFCAFWEECCGDEGQVYARYVFEPVFLSAVGNLDGMNVLEIGAGNGALAGRMVGKNVSGLTLIDISKHNIEYAKRRCGDERVRYLCQDAAEEWDVDSQSIDIIVSHMALNEMEDIAAPIREAWRVMKKDGLFVCSVFHPGFDLYVFAQEKAGIVQEKIKGLDGYFVRKFTSYDMGKHSRTNSEVAKVYKRDFVVMHFHRTISDYCNAFIDSGFIIERLLEPEINEDLLRAQSGFLAYIDRPVSLVIVARKQG